MKRYTEGPVLRGKITLRRKLSCALCFGAFPRRIVQVVRAPRTSCDVRHARARATSLGVLRTACPIGVPTSTPPQLFRQHVARNVAERRDADRVERINAARRAGQRRNGRNIRRQVGGGEQSARRLLLLGGPQLFGRDDLPEIVDAANGLLLLLGSQITVQPVRRGNRRLRRGVRLPRGGRWRRSCWRGLSLSLSLSELGLRLGRLELRRYLLLLLAQLEIGRASCRERG